MALPSNLQCALDGFPLPFFSPYSLPGSFGVNLFAQRPDNHGCLFSKPYVFPPIILIPQVLHFVKTHCFACTIVIPDVRPRKFWWPLFQSYSSFLLAPQGSQGIVLPPPPHHGVILPLGLSLGICGSSASFPFRIYLSRFIPFCFHMLSCIYSVIEHLLY